MKKTLFVSVCVFCLSFGVKADLLLPVDLASVQGKLYTNGHATDGSIPQGDCLEMMCPGANRCVESTDGNYTGTCCPENLPGWNETCGSCGCSGNYTCSATSKRCLKECSPACNACSTCNTQAGQCVPDTTKNGTNKQADGKCCVNGVFGYHQTLCPASCVINGVTYSNGQAIDTCRICNNGVATNVSDGSNTQSDGKCCVNGALTYDTTLCPASCVINGVTYSSGQAIDACRTCNNGVVTNASNGSNLQSDGRCCMNGALAYDGTYCPEPCQSGGSVCGTGCCSNTQDCINGECLDRLYCKHFGGNPCRTNVMYNEFEQQAKKRGKTTKQLVEDLCGSSYKGAWLRVKDETCTGGGKKYYPTSKSKYSSPITGSSSHDGLCKDKSKDIGVIYKYPYECKCSHKSDC